jgi:hypothetical protein
MNYNVIFSLEGVVESEWRGKLEELLVDFIKEVREDPLSVDFFAEKEFIVFFLSFLSL